MDIIAISLTALLASALTLFSGFGLGTLLMPVVALFFPAEIAIAITAIVHFANNIFKLGLLGKNAHTGVLLRFGLPAILASLTGASLLTYLSHIPPLYSYSLWGK
ncbi:MAG: TSUP family transporter, partial [Burkholderiales bacterium]|nr:TSUP family transporter [Burkholderiales bacterium]